MLARIVALLLALVDLAELAGGRSRAVCGLMLFIFRPAETAVWTFAGCPSSASPASIVPSGDARADMMQLARRFRELARILDCRAKLAISCDPENGGRSVSSPEGAALIAQAAAVGTFHMVRPVHAADTS